MLITSLRIIINVLSTIEIQLGSLSYDIANTSRNAEFLAAKKALRNSISLFVELVDNLSDDSKKG